MKNIGHKKQEKKVDYYVDNKWSNVHIKNLSMRELRL